MALRQIHAGVAAVMISLAVAMAAQAQSNPRYIRFAGCRARSKAPCSPPTRHKSRPILRF